MERDAKSSLGKRAPARAGPDCSLISDESLKTKKGIPEQGDCDTSRAFCITNKKTKPTSLCKTPTSLTAHHTSLCLLGTPVPPSFSFKRQLADSRLREGAADPYTPHSVAVCSTNTPKNPLSPAPTSTSTHRLCLLHLLPLQVAQTGSWVGPAVLKLRLHWTCSKPVDWSQQHQNKVCIRFLRQ